MNSILKKMEAFNDKLAKTFIGTDVPQKTESTNNSGKVKIPVSVYPTKEIQDEIMRYLFRG